jgi:hypothetical protein
MIQPQPPHAAHRVQIAGLGHDPPQEPMPPIPRHGPRTQVQVPVCGSCTQTSNSEGHSPAQAPLPSGPQGGGKGIVVVVVVVVGAAQLGPLPGAGHASQQLVQAPTVPCFAVQCAVSFLILHLVPMAVVIQQVTAPAGFPQIEWDAHFFTTPAQLWFTRTVLACAAAQRT